MVSEEGASPQHHSQRQRPKLGVWVGCVADANGPSLMPTTSPDWTTSQPSDECSRSRPSTPSGLARNRLLLAAVAAAARLLEVDQFGPFAVEDESF